MSDWVTLLLKSSKGSYHTQNKNHSPYNGLEYSIKSGLPLPFCLDHLISYFLKDFIYLFLERGREREREEEKHQCVVASCAHPTGDLAHNPGMCPDWESNLRPFGSQSGAQSTEPHQPGLDHLISILSSNHTSLLLGFP